MAHLISILIGFHLYQHRRKRVFTTTQVQNFINRSFSEVTYSMLTNCKNDMWAGIIFFGHRRDFFEMTEKVTSATMCEMAG